MPARWIDFHRSTSNRNRSAPLGRFAIGDQELAEAGEQAGREVLHIGKESNDLDEVQAGLVQDPDQVQTTYGRNLWDILRPIIAEMPTKRLQEELGYGRAQAYYLRSGKRCPAKKRMPALLACAGKFAREKLREEGCDQAGEEDIQAVALYLGSLAQNQEAG